MLPVSAGLPRPIHTPPSPRPPHTAGSLWAFAGSSQHTAPVLTAPPAADIATQAQTRSHRDTRHRHAHMDWTQGHMQWTWAHRHTCMCTHAHTRHVHIDTGMHKHTCTHMDTQTHRHMHTHMHTQICTRTHRCILTNVHMHNHTCTWTHAHKTHMDTDTCKRHGHMQTHPHTHGHTHTCTGMPPLHTLVTQQLLGPRACFLPRHRLFCQLGVQPWASLIRPPAQPRAKGSESHTWPFSGRDGSSRPRHSPVSRKSRGLAWRQGGCPCT